MDRGQIGTKLVLDELGLDAKALDTFNRRLIIQKAVYLAQAAGVELGYHFRWYLRGPYSPDVADDVFGLAAELRAVCDDSEGWQLDDQTAGRLETVRGLIPQGDERVRARRMELLASVHFLVTYKYAAREDTAAIQAVLQRYDKDYTTEEVEQALGELRDNDLLPG